MAEEKRPDPLTPLDLAALLTLLGQSALREKKREKK